MTQATCASDRLRRAETSQGTVNNGEDVLQECYDKKKAVVESFNANRTYARSILSSHWTSIIICHSLYAYCLPILTYAAPAIKLKACQLHELNCCWYSVYRKVFGFHRWESVRVFINGLGRLDYAVDETSLAMQNTFHC